MRNDFSNSRPAILAMITASLLMLIGGLIYYAIAARLPVPKIAAPIAPDALERLPMQIADWTGEDIPVDEEIIDRTDTDTHINRRYSHDNGIESVLLYATSGSRVGSMIDHRPDICYPAAGWTLFEQHVLELPLSNGNKLPCTILQFERNELYKETMIVLNYFIADGELYGEASATRSRAGYRLAEVRYITQVQISASVRSNVSLVSVKKIVSDFAVDSALSIAKLSDDIQRIQNSGDSRRITGGI